MSNTFIELTDKGKQLHDDLVRLENRIPKTNQSQVEKEMLIELEYQKDILDQYQKIMEGN